MVSYCVCFVFCFFHSIVFVKFIQVAPSVSGLSPSTAVHYWQTHTLSVVLGLSVVNGYFGGFQFFIATGKAALNNPLLVRCFTYARVSLGHTCTLRSCLVGLKSKHIQLWDNTKLFYSVVLSIYISISSHMTVPVAHFLINKWKIQIWKRLPAGRSVSLPHLGVNSSPYNKNTQLKTSLASRFE